VTNTAKGGVSMAKKIKTMISIFIGMIVAFFLLLMLRDNGMGLAEVLYRTGIALFIGGLLITIFAFVSVKSNKGKA